MKLQTAPTKVTHTSDTIVVHGLRSVITSQNAKVLALRDALSVSRRAPVTVEDAERTLDALEYGGESVEMSVHFLTAPIVIRDLTSAGFDVE